MPRVPQEVFNEVERNLPNLLNEPETTWKTFSIKIPARTSLITVERLRRKYGAYEIYLDRWHIAHSVTKKKLKIRPRKVSAGSAQRVVYGIISRYVFTILDLKKRFCRLAYAANVHKNSVAVLEPNAKIATFVEPVVENTLTFTVLASPRRKWKEQPDELPEETKRAILDEFRQYYPAP